MSQSRRGLFRGADNQQEPESEEVDATQPRVIQRRTDHDIDEVIRGVLLVEGAKPTDGAECARIMGEKLKYLPIDLKQTLAQLQHDEENQAQAAREEEQRQLQLLLEQQQQSQQSEGQGTDGRSDTSAVVATPPTKVSPKRQLYPPFQLLLYQNRLLLLKPTPSHSKARL